MKKLLLTMVFVGAVLHAKDYEVKMMSWGNGEPMIFDPAVLRVESGDSITFLPVQQGHQVDSVKIPEGATKMHSEIDEKYHVTLDKEGIYLYTCLPHRSMNMAGLIQVGSKSSNRDAVVKAIDALEAKATMNKGRIYRYLKQLDDMNAGATQTQPAAMSQTQPAAMSHAPSAGAVAKPSSAAGEQQCLE